MDTDASPALTSLILAVVFLGACQTVPASQRSAVTSRVSSKETGKYQMELASRLENGRFIFEFVIDDRRFKSVEALEQFLVGLRQGAELTWAPGCVIMGGEPLLNSPAEMTAFRTFLKQQGIRFTLILSG